MYKHTSDVILIYSRQNHKIWQSWGFLWGCVFFCTFKVPIFARSFFAHRHCLVTRLVLDQGFLMQKSTLILRLSNAENVYTFVP